VAGLAPPSLHIEGEAPALKPARLGVGRLGIQAPDQVEHAGIGRGVAPRGPPDGRLVDGDHLVQLPHALEPRAFARFGVGVVEVPLKGF